MSSHRPIDSFWYNKKPKNAEKDAEKKSASKRKSEVEKEGLKDKSIRKNTALYADEDLIEEIPATQSPPKKIEVPVKVVNKSLNKIKNEERGSRNVSMQSSPSIMMSSFAQKPLTSHVSLTETFVAELKAKAHESKGKSPETFDVDAIFDKLKDADKETKKIKDVPVTENEKLKENRAMEEKTEEKSPISVDLPAIVNIQSKQLPDWSKVGSETVKHLKDSCVNLRVMIDELKKANDKISEFRRGLAD